MVPASGQSTHVHRTLSGSNSPSHMPTQAVTNPLKLVGPRRRPTDCGRVRIRCTICSNTRCTYAFTVVAMVSALVSEHEARLSPPYSQTTAQCSQCCTVCGIFGAVGPEPAHDACFLMALEIFPGRERRQGLVYEYLDRLRLPAR